MLRSHRRRRLLLALLASSSAAAPVAAAPASAQVPLRFTATFHDVSVEGQWSYSRSTRETSTTGWSTTDLVSKGTFGTTLPGKLGFAYDDEGKNVTFAEAVADVHLATKAEGSYVTKVHDAVEGKTRTMTCALDGSPQSANARIVRDTQRSESSPSVFLTSRVPQSIRLPFVQGGNCPGGSFPGLDSDADLGQGRFDTTFDLPREAATAGKTIQLVSGPSHEACPGPDFDAASVTQCSLQWSAKITFERTRQETFGETDGGTDDGGLAPMPTSSTSAPAPTPSTSTPAPAPAPVDNSRSEQNMADAVSRALAEQQAREARSDDAKADAVSRAVREYLQQSEAQVRGSGASVEVELPAGSTGKLSATAIAERNAKTGVELGSAWIFPEMGVRAAVPAGAGAGATRRMTARIRFDAADRRALKRRRFVALELRVKAPGAATPVVVREVVRVRR